MSLNCYHSFLLHGVVEICNPKIEGTTPMKQPSSDISLISAIAGIVTYWYKSFLEWTNGTTRGLITGMIMAIAIPLLLLLVIKDVTYKWQLNQEWNELLDQPKIQLLVEEHPKILSEEALKIMVSSGLILRGLSKDEHLWVLRSWNDAISNDYSGIGWVIIVHTLPDLYGGYDWGYQYPERLMP